MKKLLLLASFIAFTAQAEVKEAALKSMCGPTKEILAVVVGQFSERPILIGRSETDQANITIFYNDKTKTFTVLKTATTKGVDVTCQLDAGSNFVPFNAKNEPNL